ncbi:hypothetical protein GCM10010116_04730 [Microbispora rosea subsp. aerata]|nr:hypothetical protein GCM10010116_04730 [Microbispora rosea subsp. aerata]GIH54626.1 hypothetical protein Mro02_15400 [Microbispora rosea subsp. aerata]GLJ87309.1 hypothetical protein GCM10017588_60540 [Microbispora rosea subsp. aerata]
MTLASGGMIFIGLFLIGGVISGIRQGLKPLAVLAGVGAVMAITAGVMWWQ